MSRLFLNSEAKDLYARELLLPTVKACAQDLNGAILFGAGLICHQILMHMERLNFKPAWIVDNNQNLWNTKIQGIPVRSAESLKEAGENLVLISSSFLKPMAAACSAAGVRKWSWFTDIREIFGDLSITISADEVLKEPEIDRLFDLLQETDESRLVLKKALTFRVTGESDDLPSLTPAQYFPPNLVPRRYYRSFVDCGAYNGDTLQEWIAQQLDFFTHEQLRYYGFEPDPTNFRLLQEVHSRLSEPLRSNCRLYPLAVGAESGKIQMAQGNSGTVLYDALCDAFESGPEAQVVRLDDVLDDNDVTAVKMDLEGFEPLALEGVIDILRKQRPALLISVYHRAEHLWKIPLWISDLGLGYKVHLRHHSPSFAETICYAFAE